MGNWCIRYAQKGSQCDFNFSFLFNHIWMSGGLREELSNPCYIGFVSIVGLNCSSLTFVWLVVFVFGDVEGHPGELGHYSGIRIQEIDSRDNFSIASRESVLMTFGAMAYMAYLTQWRCFHKIAQIKYFIEGLRPS